MGDKSKSKMLAEPIGVNSRKMSLYDTNIIKMNGSESWGQEEAACEHAGLHDHYSELFTWVAGLNF